jgi:hypothetical protein
MPPLSHPFSGLLRAEPLPLSSWCRNALPTSLQLCRTLPEHSHHYHLPPLLCRRRPSGASLPFVAIIIRCEVTQNQLPGGRTEGRGVSRGIPRCRWLTKMPPPATPARTWAVLSWASPCCNGCTGPCSMALGSRALRRCK